jgi:hypothetical protein
MSDLSLLLLPPHNSSSSLLFAFVVSPAPSGVGIVAGVLDGAGFTARVTAHSVKVEEGEYTRQGGNIIPGIPPRKDKAVFLVKFSPEVLTRDAALER